MQSRGETSALAEVNTTPTPRESKRETTRISGAEWRWVLATSAVILFLASLPYLAGSLAQSAQHIFFGAVFDRMDFSVHLGNIWLGLRGEWQFHFLNTSDPHPAGYVKVFYLVVGHLARLLHLSPLVAFHLARLGCGLAALVAVYRLAALCLRPLAHRRTMFLLFALGSGWGWAQLLTGWIPQADLSPIDFWHIDGYGFFSLLTFPHIAAAYALVTVAAMAGVRLLEEGRLRHGIVAGGVVLALQLVQPFAPAIVDAALIGYVLLGWVTVRRLGVRRVLSLAALGLLQLPLLAYQQWFFGSHPVWRNFVEQNVTLSPPPLYYLLGYGILAPLAVWGGWLAIRRPSWPFPHLAVAWVTTSFVMTYLPLPLQRRFTETVMVPIALLATVGLGYGLLPWVRRRARLIGSRWTGEVWRGARRSVAALTIGLASLSSLYLSLGGALLAASRSPDLFDPAAVVAGVDWLGGHSDWRTPVFAAERTGNILVGRVGHTVYLGHVIETADYERKTATVAAFFNEGMSQADRLTLLHSCGCHYVFYGPFERALGNWNPAQADFLQPAFSLEDVVVFRVNP
ncbi:MAG: hypothetical protein AB1449_12780 [Chloroflexota bacterium]